MDQSLTAKDYLLRDRLHHIDMLEALRRGTAEIVRGDPDGVLLYNPEIECWFISAATPEESEKLLAVPKKLGFVCAHQAFTMSQLREKYDFTFFLDCVQTAHFAAAPLPVADVCEFRQMESEDAEWVNENYRNIPEELDYVRLLLEKGLITGAYVSGRRAGFIGRHSEGSIGLLEVLPAFRRRGIAEALLSDAINHELALGNVPFGQVVWDNGPSLALQKKVGSEISRGHVYWMDLAEQI